MSKTIFITGATGNVGSKFAARILARHRDDRVILLVRGRSNEEARLRLLSVLYAMPATAGSDCSPAALEVLAGDITQPWLGLDRKTYKRLSSSLTHIVHSAASTCFTLPLAEAREVNFAGTVNTMELARRCFKHGKLLGVAYVSTAYVNGPSPQPICEGRLEPRTTFSNTYERTKWEAESYVQSLADILPLAIFRPSIVVGDSHTGHTNSFNVLYAPLRLIASDLVRILPGHEETRLDVVPSDYVAQAMDHIVLRQPFDSCQTFHLVAGHEQSMTVAEVVATATQTFGVNQNRRPIRIVAPHDLGEVSPFGGGNPVRVNEVLRVFAPFMTSHRSFDSTNTRRALAGSGISCPSFDQYIHTCLEYCQRTNWGKHELRQLAKEHRLKDCGNRQPGFPRRLAWDLAATP
jgi:thioester reductase-like protein